VLLIGHNIALFFLQISIRAYVTTYEVPEFGNIHAGTFYDLFSCANGLLICKRISGVNIFLNYLKLILYVEFIPRFSILFRTFRGAAGDIVSFFAVFLVVFVGFGLAHAITFGSSVYSFRSIGTAHMSLIRLLVGDMDSQKLVEADFLMGQYHTQYPTQYHTQSHT
jgi:hypothetical protein